MSAEGNEVATLSQLKEMWVDIKEYENLYQVSDQGRVRSLDHYIHMKANSVRPECDILRKGKILNPVKDKDGYLVVNLSKDGLTKKKKIHRLVAEAFLNCDNKNILQINHKDEDKTNNVVTNLEFVTCQYNINYGTRTQRAISKLGKPVYQIKNGTIINYFVSISEASRQTNCSDVEISKCCRNIVSSVKGFQWKYANNGGDE